MLKRTTIPALALAAIWSASAVPALGGEMKYPDWESQWRNPTAGQRGNPWDITKKMGLAQEAPLTPEYQAIFEASLKEQVKGGQGNSKGSTCILPGMPKMMSLSEPMEIFIKPDVTTMVPLHYPIRRIYTDGRDWPKDEPPTFTGTALGKWIDEDGDGTYDVLEVETRNLTGPRVFESSGLPLHADNQTIVKERIYLEKGNPDVMHDEVTTIDHALTRPWTVNKIFLRERDPRWIEYNCYASNNHVTIGKEEYFLSADDKLMPVRVGQAPPDLRNFK